MNIRQGKTFKIVWSILTDGKELPLEGRDLLLRMKCGKNEFDIPFTTEGILLSAVLEGKMMLPFGEYTLTLWENLGKDNQTAVDKCNAFAIVRYTCSEGGEVDSRIDIETLDLGTSNFTFSGKEVNTGIEEAPIDENTYGRKNGNWEKIDAESVLFKTDITITADVGVHTVGSTGSKTLSTSGKSIKQVMDMLFAEEKNPSITQPSVNINLNSAGAKEVGTMFTPTYSASLNKGSYQYGGDTEVVVNSWNITDKNGNSASSASGSFSQFQVKDDTNYNVTATAQHSEGSIPKTNLGNDYEAGKIVAGSKSKVSSSVIGYRNSFYGTLTNKEVLTSDAIRTLIKSNRALTNGATFNINIPLGAKRVIIAYPSSLKDLGSVLDVNGLNAQIVSSFAKAEVFVEGANGYDAIEYKVYYLDYAIPNDTANIYKVTI